MSYLAKTPAEEVSHSVSVCAEDVCQKREGWKGQEARGKRGDKNLQSRTNPH